MPGALQGIRARGVLLVACAMVLTTLGSAASATPVRAGAPAAAAQAVAPSPSPGPSVPPARRDLVLPADWRSSGDLAWTTSGDTDGFHVLAASSRGGYAWYTAATLSEPGVETDRWIGNACLTGSGRRLVVVYGPRTFTNRPDLFERGGFTAVVDLLTGAVTKLALRTSLAYFNPGCGAGETAVLTQGRSEGPAATRLHLLDAASGRLRAPVTVRGQLTSAVPARGGMVAAGADSLVQVLAGGRLRRLAAAAGVPFRLRVDSQGGVAFLDEVEGTARVRHLTRAARSATTLGSGPLGQVGLTAGAGGRVYVTGAVRLSRALPSGLARFAGPRDAQASTQGQLMVTRVDEAATVDPAYRQQLQADPSLSQEAAPVRVQAEVATSGAQLAFTVDPAAQVAARTGSGRALTPALRLDRPAAGASAAAAPPNDPVDQLRVCAVVRNDPRTQVYQPTARQVEWAADQAVVGALTMTRPANWKQSGLPSYSPQGLFPRPALTGGGRVPVQVVLGILAQESNLWQASNHALEGVTGNPLIGNYYGRDIYDDVEGNDWDIHWSDADCGYGVSQVTDGMRLSDDKYTPTQQRAIGLDYAANIAAGLQILVAKWNQVKAHNIQVNDGNPASLENWFMAVWAYNSGFHEPVGGSLPWGVGWLNNPANPIYQKDRHPFLENSPSDAAHPQDWPYPEKVMGFAAWSIAKSTGPGFRPAWWTSDADRHNVKPPPNLFCDASNDCTPGALIQPNDPSVSDQEPGPCGHKNAQGLYDLKCWYHQSATWKPNCTAAGTCGHELLRFDTTYPEQPDGTNYPPHCDRNGLPSNALIVDDTPDSVPSVRPGCASRPATVGTFGLSFAADATGEYPSKIDFHQIGGGFNGHFWFAHTRLASASGGKLKVTGTWTLNQAINGWARVMVHMPDHGAHTQQAKYDINLGNGTIRSRVVLQRTEAHRWVSLGALPFAGTPKVSLSTVTVPAGPENIGATDGSEDVAWDAVAFQPLPAKPRNIVVALGDSYSSGEGGSVTGGADYYRETDNNGDDTAHRNACHRSRNAWARKMTLADAAGTGVGARADSWDPSLDFNLLACSGAQTENLLPTGQTNAFNDPTVAQYGEVKQLERGFLDANTTLVSLSIGGNDGGFSTIVQACTTFIPNAADCQNATNVPVPGMSAGPLKDKVPELIRGKVKTSVTNVLQQIRAKAPNAKILLVGYPALFSNFNAKPDGSGPCVAGISREETVWLNSLADLLYTELNAARTAAGANMFYSDPRSAFAGKTICGSPEELHGVVVAKTPGDKPTNPVSAQGFHPKIEGQVRYGTTVTSALRSMGL